MKCFTFNFSIWQLNFNLKLSIRYFDDRGFRGRYKFQEKIAHSKKKPEYNIENYSYEVKNNFVSEGALFSASL